MRRAKITDPKRIHLILPGTLYRKLSKEAAKEHRSISAHVSHVLEATITKPKRKLV